MREDAVDAADRQIASEAAADLLNELIGIRNISNALAQQADAWGITPTYDGDFRPVQSCDELWRYGSTSIPVERSE